MTESTGNAGSTAPVHHEIRHLVVRHGPTVIADPGEFRAAFEDVLGDDLRPGAVNLLVDAVRHQVPGHLARLVATGADPASATRTAGARFAQVRGGGDAAQCTWACAVLGYAAGQVPESVVQAFAPTGRPMSEGAPPAEPTQWAPVPPPFVPPPQPVATGRSRHRLRMVGALGIVVLVLAGGAVAWRVLGPDDGARSRDGGTGADEAGRTDAGETVKEAMAVDGTLFADPGAIRPFADPATEIQGDGDLVDYLLPGLTGSGADCLEEMVDTDDVLASAPADGATTVGELVLACVAPDEIGKIFGMYAVGFEEDGRSRYADLAACVTDGFADLDRAQVQGSLVAVYVERLDLAGAPTSRLAAAEQIDELTACSTTATLPEEPDDAGEPPTNQRVIRWDRLQPGDCLVDLAPTQVTTVAAVDCRNSHLFEVVGSTFSTSADDPSTQCANLYAHYTGKQVTATGDRLEHLLSAPGSLSMRLICLVSSADGSSRTGSISPRGGG